MDRPPARVKRSAPYDLLRRQSEDSLSTAIARSNAAIRIQDDNAILRRCDYRPITLLSFS